MVPAARDAHVTTVCAKFVLIQFFTLPLKLFTHRRVISSCVSVSSIRLTDKLPVCSCVFRKQPRKMLVEYMHKQARMQAWWSMEKHWARFSKATITSGTNTHTKQNVLLYRSASQLLGKHCVLVGNTANVPAFFQSYVAGWGWGL